MMAWKNLSGILQVELTSAEAEYILSLINGEEIEIIEIHIINELTIRFKIHRSDYDKVKKISQQRGGNLNVVRKQGAFWLIKTLPKRKILFAFIILFLTVVIYLPSRVFFVRVEGNASIPSNKIREAADQCGIGFNASRREVRSEKMKNELLSRIPELQWAGVNTTGCVATITVRERSLDDIKSPRYIVSNIVAGYDGYILSGTVTKGNGVFQIGQSVKAGQVLISGYTDCGTCIQATRAEGEIYAETKRHFSAVYPGECIQKEDLIDTKRKFSLLFRKNRINLWKDSGISDTSCDRMYKEYYITLPGGFCLPIALCIETYKSFNTSILEIPQEYAEAELSDCAQRYLATHMIAGSIQKLTQQFVPEDSAYRLNGEYICTEMIAREQQEKIGDTNGENS